MVAGSSKLAAAQAAVQSKALQSEGLRGLGGPIVNLSASAFAYSANLNVDLDPLNQRIVQLEQRLPIPLSKLPIPLPTPQFPAHYTFNRQSTATTASPKSGCGTPTTALSATPAMSLMQASISAG